MAFVCMTTFTEELKKPTITTNRNNKFLVLNF